ncbi:peptidase [bacterium]|nr:MAG: peptidase [bacterium]
MSHSPRLLACLTLSVAAISALAQKAPVTDLKSRLAAIPGVVSVTAPTNPRLQKDTFVVMFDQPVDPLNPKGARFQQRLFLRHAAFDQPMILGTEGYEAGGPDGGELEGMFDRPNVLTVEHRYFGKSVPTPLVWQHLTIKNAAADMHRIVTAFKSLYRGKWVSTGVSKGGQTALFFKCFYPNDVDATVAYVAPINLGQEDPRLISFFQTIGDEAIRKRMLDFQIALLKREDEIIPLLGQKPEQYSMGLAKAYEYGVLEYPFSYWQYSSAALPIPAPDAPAKEMADAYKRIGALYFYSDAGRKQFGPFYYQAYTEIGYYNYDITDLKPYLKANPNPTNMDLLPPGLKENIVYKPNTLAFVYRYLQYKAQNVAFVYGETDAWSATQMELLGRTNAVKLVVKGGNHGAGVQDAAPKQKEQFYSALDKWMSTKLKRL